MALMAGSAGAAQKRRPSAADPLEWPSVTRESRPWTRWWWLGNAVSEAEITRSLEAFQKAGLGGVEVSPIYGVKGAEERYVEYLTPRWIELFRHTSREAARLGMGADMIQGTGWPFGGPTVKAEDAAMRFLLTPIPLDDQGRLTGRLPGGAPLQALVAYSADGQIVDLTDRVKETGRLDWTPPAGKWTLYGLQYRGTNQQVKRSGPGGEGLVLDHFGGAAIGRYLQHFERPLASLSPDAHPRCLFNDSFEVYGANWTPELLAEFQKRRGYDLRRYLPELMGRGNAERGARVRADYRETVHDLLLANFTRRWTEWAHQRGSLTRNQAHGSPANVLDLYAAVDIPETEMFGPGRRGAGSRGPAEPAPAARWQDIAACKLASSAAHVSGKRLCSSESTTWLTEHFQTSLADVKGQVDSLLVSGVNHLFYHGTPFSPSNAEWPGWLFYASTEYTPTNPWWRDFSKLNAYVTRCQSFLQSGAPDNDVLVYFPIHDLWATDAGARNGLQYLTVHDTDSWLEKNLDDFAATVKRLWERGYSYDFVSDAQLRDDVSAQASGALKSKGGTHRVLLVAGARVMPPETLERILALAQAGAKVVFLGEPPRDVPGLSKLEERKARLASALQALVGMRPDGSPAVTNLGKGKLFLGSELEPLLDAAGSNSLREGMVDLGLEFIRRVLPDGGKVYFIANRSDKAVDGWVPLAAGTGSALLFDPMTGDRGVGVTSDPSDGARRVYLQMEPGESILVRMVPGKPVKGERWEYHTAGGRPQPLGGEWEVEFLEGGPELPARLRASELKSWTDLPGETEKLRSFSGTARYRLRMEVPKEKADAWVLDLGAVAHTARVRLDGQDAGTLVAPPYRLKLGELKPGAHELELEVSNLMANRIASMDRRKIPWQKFFFVNIDYKPFDASGWKPLPSGLLGPVTLQPLWRLRPR